MFFKKKLQRRRFRFYGEVQAVGFRWTALTAAKRCGATGWVKNEPDGSVSMEVQGAARQIKRVLDALQADDYIRIEQTEEATAPVVPDEKDFRVKYE